MKPGVPAAAVHGVAVRRRDLDRALPVWIGAALALVVLMALPLGWLVVDERERRAAAPRSTTIAPCSATPALRKALWNTVVLAFWVGLVSVAIGAPLAWLTARTDLPGKGLIRAPRAWPRSSRRRSWAPSRG